jgi:carbonic anhydrase/acetyltransferase-like protein (isoleucine patch superfamily)
MTIYALGDTTPVMDETAYIAGTAEIIGRVRLGPYTSVWSNAVLRADNEPIEVGSGSNVQDGAILHADPGYPLSIGHDVSIGHQAMLHGCTIGDGSLVGIQAVVLNGAVIGRNCLVAAGAIVTEGKVFGDNLLILGAPAKAVRELSESDIAGLAKNASGYIERSAYFKKHLKRLS